MTSEALHEIAHPDCVHVTARCMFYLLSIRIHVAYKRARKGKESRWEGGGGVREKLTLLFHKQSVIVRCNNYLTQLKPITILKIPGEVYTRFNSL